MLLGVTEIHEMPFVFTAYKPMNPIYDLLITLIRFKHAAFKLNQPCIYSDISLDEILEQTLGDIDQIPLFDRK